MGWGLYFTIVGQVLLSVVVLAVIVFLVMAVIYGIKGMRKDGDG